MPAAYERTQILAEYFKDKIDYNDFKANHTEKIIEEFNKYAEEITSIPTKNP